MITVYNYISNPVLSDTDFDGINDKEDPNERNNDFRGILNANEFTHEVEFNLDYRKFFKSNKNLICIVQ